MKPTYQKKTNNIYKVDVKSFYHPIASVIVQCIEKRSNFINRGLFEIKNLQSESFAAEKFAITTEQRFLDGFLRDFFYLQKNVSVAVPPLGTSISNSFKIYNSKEEEKYRLIFSPMDSVNNFGKGFGECGCFCALQSIVQDNSENIAYEDVFSLFYSFKTQKFLYAENKGMVFLENKRMKAVHKKTSLTIAMNSTAILYNFAKPSQLQNSKIKNIISRGDGIVSDCFDLANGSIDGIIYNQIQMWQLIPLKILLQTLTCYSSEIKIENKELTKNIDLIAGSEVIVKNF